MKELLFDTIVSPIGTLRMIVDGGQICALDFEEQEDFLTKTLRRRYGEVRLKRTDNPCGFSEQIRRYFAGDYGSLDALPIDPGGTPFQRHVWQTLRAVPPGTTVTYAELAAEVGRPTAYRAVGAANAGNPIVLIIPCHRVIGSNASLTGYGPGLERKLWLLRHEGNTNVFRGCEEKHS